MTAVIYTRVSTDEQAQKGYSLEVQAEACRSKASALGAAEILQFSDEGVSGSLLRRPGLDAALDAIRRRKADIFICTEPDRLSRKLAHQLLLTDEIERDGCRIEFVAFDWDSGAEGRLFYAIKGALAEYERHKILERTRAGKIQKAMRGELTHSPNTYGYTFDSASDRLVVSTVEAPVVRHAFDLAAWLGMGAAEIASRLNSVGIPSPRGRIWSRTTVARMLHNRAYSGVMHLQRFDTEGKGQNKYRPSRDRVRVRERPEDQWIPVSVPALVDEATWQKAQASMEAARRRRPGLSKRRYILRGLVRCGLCGHTMHGSLATSRGVKRPYYVCTAKSPGVAGQPSCRQPYFPSVPLEEAVWATVAALLLSPAALEALNPAAGQAGPESSTAVMTGFEARESQIAAVTLDQAIHERERLIDLYQRGVIGKSEMDARIKAVQDRMRLSRATLEQSAVDCVAGHRQLGNLGDHGSAGRADDVGEAVLHLELVRAFLDGASDAQQEAIIRSIVQTITVERRDAITVCCYVPGLPPV
jgi:site-specific DNA recombinase